MCTWHVSMWRSEDNLKKSVLYFHHGFWGLNSKYFYALCHLAGPQTVLDEKTFCCTKPLCCPLSALCRRKMQINPCSFSFIPPSVSYLSDAYTLISRPLGFVFLPFPLCLRLLLKWEGVVSWGGGGGGGERRLTALFRQEDQSLTS